MIALLGFVIFAGAFVTAASVIAAMVAPQWERIVGLASGHPETVFAPLATLAVAEQRIAVRSWAAQPIHASLNRLREAA